MRVAATLAFLIVTAMAGTTNADHHHKVWWKYLTGSWTYVDTDGKGEVTFAAAPTGDALIGQWKDDDGSTAYEVVGYQADRKILLVTGYGSQGNYWHLELDKTTADVQEGSNRGRLPDGTTYKGKIVIKRVDENNWTWDLVGKKGNGEELTMNGKVTRKR